MDMVLSFFDRLYSVSARHGEGDRLVWNPSKKGLFEVRSFYEVLIGKDGSSFPYFPWKNMACQGSNNGGFLRLVSCFGQNIDA
jgi:hypothetical protein